APDREVEAVSNGFAQQWRVGDAADVAIGFLGQIDFSMLRKTANRIILHPPRGAQGRTPRGGMILSSSRRLLRRIKPGIDAAFEAGKSLQAFPVGKRQQLH